MAEKISESEKKKNPRLIGQMVIRVVMLVLLDSIAVNLAAFGAIYLRVEFNYASFLQFAGEYLDLVIPNTLFALILFWALDLFRSLWAYAGGDEMIRIVIASALAAGITAAEIFFLGFRLPRSFPAIYFVLLLVLMVSLHGAYRFARRSKRVSRKNGIRTMLIGAGDAGASLMQELRYSTRMKNFVVCVIDDDPQKIGKRFMGVPVAGDRYAIPKTVEAFGVEEIIFAIPSISHTDKREILEICQQTGCRLRQIGGLDQFNDSFPLREQIRDVRIEDLLGRDELCIRQDTIAEYIKDKTVLVTGGGGSIGSELCRQLAGFSPARLIIFDIYENNAYEIQQELCRNYPALPLTVLIGSVRDKKRLDAVMETYHPEIVYHAAAHKHVPLMEDAPLEAVKNNVFGTYNTALSAAEHGVGRFLLISTDKAVNPTNVMGASKRICEMLVQMMDEQYEGTSFSAVRFGNVLGSNGSVIPLFRQQISNGGPVTVTHKEITRFFMTIPEAVSLVLQAGAYAKGGEIFVLDMGKPVQIDDLARKMIRLSGFTPDVDIPIVYTGLRPGEKLYEELLMSEEGLQKTSNDLIFIGHKTDFDRERFQKGLADLRAFPENRGDAELRTLIASIVPTYHPAEN